MTCVTMHGGRFANLHNCTILIMIYPSAFLAQNFHYKFVDADAGNTFATKFYTDFLPTLSADAKPTASHYGP